MAGKSFKPLPPRGGLGATRARVPSGPTPTAFEFVWHLVSTQRHRHPEDDESAVAERFDLGEVVLANGVALSPSTLVPPGTDVYFYRRPAPEAHVPYEITVVHEDNDIMVVNKPPFLATMPRAAHITETATVRLRRATGNEELTPAHRLDRMTSGLLLLTKRAEIRGAYQELFARREVGKLYEAIADFKEFETPVEWAHFVDKQPGEIAATIRDDLEPNSSTILRSVTRLESQPALARYVLEPVTGRTHQLRIQMNAAGVPIVGDPVYPVTKPFGDEDFSVPMLLASVRLRFVDPLSGQQREFATSAFPDMT